MGFVQKIVGSLTGANKQARAIEEGARQQADATRQAANSASEAARQSAAQAAQAQAGAAARNVAVSNAADALDKPPEVADVQIEEQAPMGAAKKRREKFGIGSSNTGVNI
jgi:hypothetical protein